MLYDALIAPVRRFRLHAPGARGRDRAVAQRPPVGVFLMLRRMSLTGDAMAHAILPGAAVGFLLAGLELFAMTVGGLVAGFAVALLAGLVARVTMKEDASLAAFYLISLALGVTSSRPRHQYRPDARAVRHRAGAGRPGAADRRLQRHRHAAGARRDLAAAVLECIDPVFLRTVSRAGGAGASMFLALVVLNLVSGFQALGTLLAVGLMMLPAASRGSGRAIITGMICIAVVSADRPAMPGWCCRLDPSAVGPRDHSGGGAPRRLRAVRSGWRPGRRRFPAGISKREHDAALLLCVALVWRCSRTPLPRRGQLKVVASFRFSAISSAMSAATGSI